LLKNAINVLGGGYSAIDSSKERSLLFMMFCEANTKEKQGNPLKKSDSDG
jgi:hypothetical protein